ncbi:ImuA family protein [Neorhizobium alkalisoli]|uniref:Protein ImuA n=1 Tax=Neorhizobium alkalisoli TaxID=528178 RepID=A0A561Q7Q2_9HYPH|nr:ImuA family protein [Neorhizobium alkalisoli]TWF46416.1 protein ImuA [Neorhizobium alkalisoli]
MVPVTVSQQLVADLQDRIDQIGGLSTRHRSYLPFGMSEMDDRIPGGGLAFGATHEVAGGGSGAVDGAAAALFAAGIAARASGPVIWCITRTDLFAPALQQVGLDLNRVIFVECGDETSILESMEEALRYRGVGVAIAELVRLPMVASRRFQLAAEQGGAMGLIIRRWRRQTEATDLGHPTASVTRWRVSSLPSEPLPVEGVGRPRWLVELLRSRAGESFDVEVGACDERGQLSSVRTAYEQRRMVR